MCLVAGQVSTQAYPAHVIFYRPGSSRVVLHVVVQESPRHSQAIFGEHACLSLVRLSEEFFVHIVLKKIGLPKMTVSWAQIGQARQNTACRNHRRTAQQPARLPNALPCCATDLEQPREREGGGKERKRKGRKEKKRKKEREEERKLTPLAAASLFLLLVCAWQPQP